MNLIMSFILACEILIIQPTRTIKFRQVNEVTIEKSWRELADTCEIKLPKHVSVNGERTNTIEKYISVGDAVSVKLWYANNPIHEEFNGFIKSLKPNIPFEIHCEDNIYFLRKTKIKKSWKKADSVTLKQVVKYLIDQVNAQHPTARITMSGNLPEVTFSEGLVIDAGNTAATALEKIRENYGLVSYFKGKELFTGLAYQQTFGDVKYSLAWNVIENDLTYRNEDDVRLKAKAIGIRKDNQKVTVDDVGDEDGEQRTFYYYNVTDKVQLKKLAEEELKRLKFTGYEGDLTTFLYPYAEPLMVADLKDPNYGESRSGRYIVDSVKTVFSADGGARRTVELGIKLTV